MISVKRLVLRGTTDKLSNTNVLNVEQAVLDVHAQPIKALDIITDEIVRLGCKYLIEVHGGKTYMYINAVEEVRFDKLVKAIQLVEGVE